MLYRLRRTLNRAMFNWQVRPLLRTKPLQAGDAPITLVSMVCHGEVMMYVLAVKSFCYHLHLRPRIVILNDGSLSRDDLDRLKNQLPKSRVVDIADVSNTICPRGNCWERLLLISDLSQDSYVVQLDSDTLTLAALDEVSHCITGNRSFTLLGDRSYPDVELMPQAWQRLRHNQSTQVQGICERNFNQLSNNSTLYYLRGNAGFSGFAQGSLSREWIAAFSEQVRAISQGTWDTWGSEQVMSNLLIANTAHCCALPSPKYVSHWAHPDVRYEDAAFVHWIGPYRYAFQRYARLARKEIGRLPS